MKGLNKQNDVLGLDPVYLLTTSICRVQLLQHAGGIYVSTVSEVQVGMQGH